MPERLIDVPIESLPFVDEHAVEVEASAERTWAAMLATVRGLGRGHGRLAARALGCLSLDSSGEIGRIGSTMPGFIVTRSIPPALLALMGEHRFSRYALVFSVTPLGDGDHVRVAAETRAEFPGRSGRVYRRLVIGSRGHVLATRTILRAIKRRAEASGA